MKDLNKRNYRLVSYLARSLKNISVFVDVNYTGIPHCLIGNHAGEFIRHFAVGDAESLGRDLRDD